MVTIKLIPLLADASRWVAIALFASNAVTCLQSSSLAQESPPEVHRKGVIAPDLAILN